MEFPQTPEEFVRVTNDFRNTERFREPLLFAVGKRVVTGNGVHASTRYPLVNGPKQNLGTAAVLMQVLDIPPEGVQSVKIDGSNLDKILRFFHPFKDDGKKHANIELLHLVRNCGAHNSDDGSVVATFVFDDADIEGVDDATLKLYGLSNRLFRPNSLNLKGIFPKLPNVTWVGDRPFDTEEVENALLGAAFDSGDFAPGMIDKFPLYAHRINGAKLGVRITDANKVRLGAYLGEGTTLMPGASYVNFNAGTEGPSMIEGRVSSSAFVGAGSDIGGGASMLGTLSGGNSVPISVGRNCLLEVNSALGIPIGDAVIIAAETAVMASSQVRVNIQGHMLQDQVVKASELAGINAVTFRRNDKNGALEVVRTRRNVEFARKLADGDTILTADLHKND